MWAWRCLHSVSERFVAALNAACAHTPPARPAPRRSKGLSTPRPWSALSAGPEGEAAVRGLHEALAGMGLEGLPLGAPRIVVPSPEEE